jgi:pyridoxine 5-phosphate synthase
MTALSVNVNKFALLRNSRGANYPDVATMAERAIRSGVHGITVHPRPDQRHIRYSDLPVLRDLTRREGVELNVEGSPIPEFLELVVRTAPDQCTLVPDARDQLTSDHGWDVERHQDVLISVVRRLRERGIRISLFMDADPSAMERARATGADRIELYTESWARAFDTEDEAAVWSRFEEAARRATDLGLGINAGHDLNLRNLARFLRIPSILEVSIGHAIVVESFDFGYEETLRRYLDIVSGEHGTSRGSSSSVSGRCSRTS